MNDLKDFLDKNHWSYVGSHELVIDITKLGLFFWERGGKDAIKMFKEAKISLDDLKYLITFASIGKRMNTANLDFLDCLACLGEEKVKQLIKEMVGEEK